jgi:hypothetical protein
MDLNQCNYFNLIRLIVELNDEDIVAQAVLFFVAGFDTVSTVMCFLGHELALNPEIQKRLQDEIDEIVKDKGSILDYNTLVRLKYMDMVVSGLCMYIFLISILILFVRIILNRNDEKMASNNST